MMLVRNWAKAFPGRTAHLWEMNNRFDPVAQLYLRHSLCGRLSASGEDLFVDLGGMTRCKVCLAIEEKED